MIDGNKVIIIRADNGWILEREKFNDFDEGTFTVREVFEDVEAGLDSRVGRAESLSNLLWEAFTPEYQSNHLGGLSVEIKELGRAFEEETASKTIETAPDPLNVEKML